MAECFALFRAVLDSSVALSLSFSSEWTVYTATFSPSSQDGKGHQLDEGEHGDQCGYWGFLLENVRLH